MLVYEYKIPDPNWPRPGGEDKRFGPTAALVPFHPEPLRADQILDREVDELTTRAGTYGMGGPGFVGLRLGADWLVVAIWGAAEWMLADGLPIEDTFFAQHGRPEPWITDRSDKLASKVIGQRIQSIEIDRRSLKLLLSNGLEMIINESAERRPILEGSKEPRAFQEDDDLRRAVFLSPTIEIWV